MDAHLLHSPGGKVLIRIRDMVGDAGFSPCGTRRLWLSRVWDETGRTILWIGMNPSTATAEANDPTVGAEIDFSRKWGFGRYLKANVMDYRATSPKDLLRPGIVPCGEENLPTIRRLALEADHVVLAFGKLDRKLLRHGLDVIGLLREIGIQPSCLALTKEGWPRHPLYIKRDKERIDFHAPVA